MYEINESEINIIKITNIADRKNQWCSYGKNLMVKAKICILKAKVYTLQAKLKARDSTSDFRPRQR